MPAELYLQSLLATDGRIVAEDETHAIVTLRLPKDLISRNLPLLRALSELTAARPAGAAAATEPARVPCCMRPLPKWPGSR